MPNYVEYQQSVAAEFKAYENRIRNLIDNSHWPEEGRYKEIILMNYLKKILPGNLSVGTGFVRNGDQLTNQIDLIIYDNLLPVLFSEGDFVITTPENVIGIIEVKSQIRPSDLCNIIGKANYNAEVICKDTEKRLFNGVFSYNSESDNCRTIVENLKNLDYTDIIQKQHFNQTASNRIFNCVNHVALGNKVFIKAWPLGQVNGPYIEEIIQPYYSIYEMPNELAVAYFFANLQEVILRNSTQNYINPLPNNWEAFLYPIPEGKEMHLIERVDF